MKSTFFSFNILLLIALLFLAGCFSGKIHPIVSQDSAVSRDKAIVVMGISFKEKYNDTEDNEIKALNSADLLKQKELLKKRLEEKDGTALYLPLYYLNHFRFQFENPEGETHEVIRFDKDTRGYEEIAIHEFDPGRFKLVNINTTQVYFDQEYQRPLNENRWVKHWKDYEYPYGEWDFESGQVLYTGHMTLYFETKRFILGMITPEELVSNIELVAIVVEDRFEAVQEQLKKEKPWFPLAEMENRSQPGKWVLQAEAFEFFDPSSSRRKTEEDSNEPKRDKKKFFF